MQGKRSGLRGATPVLYSRSPQKEKKCVPSCNLAQDGFQKACGDGMTLYDVALWLKWPPCAFPLVGLIDADDCIEAIKKMMNVHHVERTARASVKISGNGFITRYQHVAMVEGTLEGDVVLEDSLR